MSDLIKREDAIEVLAINAPFMSDEAYLKLYDALNAIHSVEPNRCEWTPCSERLPSNFSEDETVLATTDVDDDEVIQMFALDVKRFYLKGYVSAWMPLPEPWKGADDERP